MSDLIPQETIGSLLPLLQRANAVAEKLASAKYSGESSWTAEIRIVIKHGYDRIESIKPDLFPTPPIYETKVEVYSWLSGKRFTLEEAELIAENLDRL